MRKIFKNFLICKIVCKICQWLCMIIDQCTFQLFTYEFFLFGQIFLDLGILIIELLCLQSKSILVFIFFMIQEVFIQWCLNTMKKNWTGTIPVRILSYSQGTLNNVFDRV